MAAKRSATGIFLSAVLMFMATPVGARTYTVDDDGPADYATISAAMAVAGAGDIVYVFPGVYREQVVLKNAVSLFGSGPDVTTIDGRGVFARVVTYNGTLPAIISGFKITGGRRTGGVDWTYSGIYCQRGPIIIRNNIIQNNLGGIAVNSLSNPTIINNTIVENTNGIILGQRTEPPPKVDVAYIYSKDKKTAASYASFLMSSRISVNLIPLEEVADRNFSDYGVIVVGPDTGWSYDWGTPAAVTRIVKSDKPVLGLGFGGACCFQQMGLSINWGHGWLGKENSIVITEPDHPIFKAPSRIYLLPIRLPIKKSIQLYTTTEHIGEYAPHLSKRVVLLGREPDDPNHYPLVEESGHILWGFNASPDYMTKTGRSLFLNIIYYLHPFLPAPAKTHTIMNNILANNSSAGIFYYVYGRDGSILYNDVWGNHWRNYHDNHSTSTFLPDPGTGEISADPLFVGVNYRLGKGSPCRDKGNPAAQYNDPDGTRNDMGAYGGPGAIEGMSGFPGSGFVFTSIGKIPTSEIVQDLADPSHGLADVNSTIANEFAIYPYKDAPFGGWLWIHGLFGESDDVDYYQILAGKWDGDSEPGPDDYAPLTDSLTKVRYFVDPNGTVTYKYISLGPQTLDNVDNLYQLTRDGYWSHIDLRMIWDTNRWDNGKYTLTYKAYRWNSITEKLEQQDPHSTTLDHLTLIIDNSHVDANIISIKYDITNPNYDAASDGNIPECGIIHLTSNTENLRFNITAWHPNGYLLDYHLYALYGKDKSSGQVVWDQYVGAHDSPGPLWPGVFETEFNSTDAPPGQLLPWQTCAYQFRLGTWARTTDGFTHVYYDESNVHYYLNVGLCAWCAGADLNNSGRVDFVDLAILASYWLEPCGPTCE